MNIKTAYLYGFLEVIFIEPPIRMSSSKRVYKLHKALYGLKQGAQVWNRALLAKMLEKRFKHLNTYLNIWIQDDIIVVIYVNNLSVIGLKFNTLTLSNLSCSDFLR